MDPNEALRLMREAIDELKLEMREIKADGSDVPELAVQVIERWETLDEWLSKGGFHPAEWTPDERMRRPKPPAAFGYEWVHGHWRRQEKR